MNQALRAPSLFVTYCLLCCVGISTFLMSSALAQVNGPGPSPANDFDSVVNLPNDDTSMLGDFSVIGGIAGETMQLNIDVDGVIGDDSESQIGGEVNVRGGTLGARFMAGSGSEVNISSGSVGSSLQALSGSLINISGGNVSDSLEVSAGSEVNISGGTLRDIVARGSMNISGGNIERLFQANSGSVITVSGGSIDAIAASGGSQVNLIGREFFVDGQELDTLVPGEAFTVTDRDGSITGLLADGQPFSFPLDTGFSVDGNFSSNATLTVTLDASVLLGDVNRDGLVNFLDIAPFIGILSAGGVQAEADINQDGVVNFLDIAPFIGVLTTAAG